MHSVAVRLFGKFEAERNGRVLRAFEAAKVRELFCYLLIHRNRPHPRESLAATFWRDVPTLQSKKYLRQVLWQLQAAFECSSTRSLPFLTIDSQWVHLEVGPGLWLDVAHFEEAFAGAHGIAGAQLKPAHIVKLRNAVHLYAGDLLDGCYHEWCLVERERLQNMHLVILDKLTAYCETRQLFEEGLFHATRILRYDSARERTHRQVMRLFYLAGDRTAALRQYLRCVKALQQELGVDPSEQTVALYERIRRGHVTQHADIEGPSLGTTSATRVSHKIHGGLQRLSAVVAEAERQVQQEIATLETALDVGLNRADGGRGNRDPRVAVNSKTPARRMQDGPSKRA